MSEILNTPLDEYVRILFYLYKQIPQARASDRAEYFIEHLAKQEHVLNTMTLRDITNSLQDSSVRANVFDLILEGVQQQQGGAMQHQGTRDDTTIGIIALSLFVFCVLIAPNLCESIHRYATDNPEAVGGVALLTVQILFAVLFFYNATRSLTPEEQRLQQRRRRESHPINMLNEVLITIGTFLANARERVTGRRTTVWNATQILEPPHLRAETEVVDPVTMDPIPVNQNYYVSKNDNGMFRILSSAEGMQSMIDSRLRNSNPYEVFSPTLGRIVQARNVKRTKRTVGGTRRRRHRRSRRSYTRRH
jgi:hypothetical protein